MNKLMESWTDEQWAEWNAWLAERPECVRKMAEAYPPGYYMLMTTGQVGRIVSYNENGTVTMQFPQELNPQQIIMPNRQVFGIEPTNLRPVEEAEHN